MFRRTTQTGNLLYGKISPDSYEKFYLAMQYSEPIRYNAYEIYKDRVTNKYGIRNVNTDQLVVKCVFDHITLYEEAKLFLFFLNVPIKVFAGEPRGKLNQW